MSFIEKNIEKYVEEYSSKPTSLLDELERETFLRVLQPRMLSGSYQGRLLSIISKMLRPKTIVEIGTFTGYATLCLAEGLEKDGVIHTIDPNEELLSLQREFFQKSHYAEQIVQHTAQALDVIPSLPDGIDLVFIDADKKNYVNYFYAVVDKLRKGGVILSDNVLWSGKVIEQEERKDKHTQVLLEYNRILCTDIRMQSVILPIRDGITISIKK